MPVPVLILLLTPPRSQFTVFLAGLEAHGLTSLLEGPAHLTLLVPTDEAFSRLPPSVLAKVEGGACGLAILQAHLLQQPLCAAAVQVGQVHHPGTTPPTSLSTGPDGIEQSGWPACPP